MLTNSFDARTDRRCECALFDGHTYSQYARPVAHTSMYFHDGTNTERTAKSDQVNSQLQSANEVDARLLNIWNFIDKRA